MYNRKDFVIMITHKATGSTWNKELNCKIPAIEHWATIKESNKYAGTFSFWLNDDEDKQELYKVGTRSIEAALEKICTDPAISFPEESLEMQIMYANKYSDINLLDDECVSLIVQVAVFGDILDV